MSGLSLDGALRRVCDMKGRVDTEALQVLRDEWEEAFPIIQGEVSGAEYPDEEADGLLQPLLCAGVLLCGELKETRIFEPLIEAFDQGAKDGMFDDLSPTQLGAVWANCSGGDPGRLLEIFQDQDLWYATRMQAFRALGQLRMRGIWEQSEFERWLTEVLETACQGEQSFESSFLITRAAYFLPEVAEHLGGAYFDSHSEDEGCRNIFELFNKLSPEKKLEELEVEYRPLGTADEELAEIFGEFDVEPENELEYLLNHPAELLGIIPDPDEDDVEMIPTPEIGRNEACPCGSGKKFKKCCINEPFIRVPQTAVDWMGNPISEKNFLANGFLEAGYLHKEAGDEVAQVASWILFASLLEELVPAHIQHPADVERRQIFCGYEPLESWISHFLLASMQLMMKDDQAIFYVELPILWINKQFIKAPKGLREQMVLLRGFVYAAQKDKAKDAIEDFKQVLEWRPDNTVAISLLAALYLDRLGDPDVESARELLEKGLMLVSDEGDKKKLQQQLVDMNAEYGGLE